MGCMFYTFQQNNSGGRFSHSPRRLTRTVVVEANSAAEANDRLCGLGGYFNGVEEDVDCSCCGDRWYPCSESDGAEVPSIYGIPLVDVKNQWDWMDGDPSVYVHMLDGRVFPFHVHDGRYVYKGNDLFPALGSSDEMLKTLPAKSSD